MAHFNLILRALMLSTSKANVQKELGQIAQSFQNAINWAEQIGFEQRLREQFLATFTESETLTKHVSPKIQ